MAMQFEGKDGAVHADGALLGHLDNWSMTINQALSEHTSFGDWDDKFIFSTRNTTGSASGTLDLDGGQDTIIDLMVSDNSNVIVVLDLYNSGAYKFYGSALISSVNIGVTTKDKQSISFNFQMSGGVSRAEA